jgi:nuclease-like protein
MSAIPHWKSRPETEIHTDRRQEVFGRYLAPVVQFVTGEPQSTSSWEESGCAEERVGSYLSKSVGLDGVVLHDRSVPGAPADIDHIAIVPSGVWVIGTKQFAGRVQQRDLGGWLVSRPALFVNGQDRSSLIGRILQQLDSLEPLVGPEVPLHAALCFADTQWGLLGRSFTIEGVQVTWANKLAAALVADGPLSVDAIRTVAGRIATALPAYAPSGTSQSPIGA